MTATYAKLEKELEYSRNEKVQQEDLFKGRTNKGADNSSGRQELIQKGHDIQEEGLQGLNRVLKNVHVMKDQANTINVELDRQINQLDSIYDNMKDMDTTMKRAEVHLRYFARQVYTDRLMMCLIVVIILAIITIIILKIIGKTPQDGVDKTK